MDKVPLKYVKAIPYDYRLAPPRVWVSADWAWWYRHGRREFLRDWYNGERYEDEERRR